LRLALELFERAFQQVERDVRDRAELPRSTSTGFL